jgi:hypothetical protein
MDFKLIPVIVLTQQEDGTFVASGVTYDREGTALAQYCPEWAHPILKVKYQTGANAPISEEEWDAINAKLTRQGRKPLPVSKKFATSIVWDDGTYISGVIGTTSVKDGVVLYVHTDDAKLVYAKFDVFYKKAEDVVRLSRALLADGSTYGYTRTQMRIAIVKKNTVLSNGIVVGDGLAVINQKVFPESTGEIKLGLNDGHYSVYNTCDWENIKEDVTARSEVFKEEMARGDWVKILNAVVMADDPRRAQLLKLCPALWRHPYVGGEALSSKSAVTLGNWMHAPWVETEVKYIIATEKVTGLPAGNWSFHRFPMLLGSNRTVEVEEYTPIPDSVVCGHTSTLTGFWEEGSAFTAKVGGVVVSEMPKGYEDCQVIMCPEDLKMGELVAGTTWNADVTLTVIQKFSRDCIVGMPPELWALVNGDYDSDLGYFTNHKDTPQLFKEIKRISKHGRNFKFKKKSILPYTIENANKVMSNAMAQDMGFATNLRWWWHSLSVRKQTEYMGDVIRTVQGIHARMNVEQEWKGTLIGIDETLSAAVQYQVDSIKNLYCNTRFLHDALCGFQSNMLGITKKNPGYTVNKRSGIAYSVSIPTLLSEMDEDMKALVANNRKYKKTYEYRINIPDICDGTPVQIYKLHRPIIEEIWHKLEMRPNPLPSRNFANWVAPVSPEAHMYAHMLVEKFKRHVSKYEVLRQTGDFNPSNPEDSEQYVSQWVMECKKHAKTYFDGNMMACAKALWRELHQDGTPRKVFGALFDGFFQETCALVAENALTPRAVRCILVGWKDYDKTPADFTCVAQVFSEKGKTIVNPEGHVRMEVAKVDKKDGDRGFSIPAPGMYMVHCELTVSKTAYHAAFEPLVP